MGSVIVIAVCMLLLMLLLLSNATLDNGTMEDVAQDIQEKVDDVQYESGSTGYDIAWETAVPAEVTKEDMLNGKEEYSFTIANEELLREEGFTDAQLKASKAAIEKYIVDNKIVFPLHEVMAIQESIYSCGYYFGAVFLLNEEEYTYVMVTGNGESIKCEQDFYSDPPVQYDMDIEGEAEDHDVYDMLFTEDWPMGIEEFPYTEADVSRFLETYYADLTSKNMYENYLIYSIPMRDYMLREWPSFNCQFSTFKKNVQELKKTIADGDEELAKTGKLSASVKKYRQKWFTMVVVKVDIMLSSGKKSKNYTDYVSIGYDDNGLFVIPQDMFLPDHWRYLYLY